MATENAGQRPVSVVEAVESDLKALGLSSTGEGRAAVVLAARLDDLLGEESTAALAAAARELRMLLADMRARPMAVKADPVDDIAAARKRRRAG